MPLPQSCPKSAGEQTSETLDLSRTSTLTTASGQEKRASLSFRANKWLSGKRKRRIALLLTKRLINETDATQMRRQGTAATNKRRRTSSLIASMGLLKTVASSTRCLTKSPILLSMSLGLHPGDPRSIKTSIVSHPSRSKPLVNKCWTSTEVRPLQRNSRTRSSGPPAPRSASNRPL